MDKKLVNIIGFLASIFLFIVLLSSFLKGMKRIEEGNRLIAKSKLKLENAINENKRLTEQIKIVQSDQYIEKEMREERGLVKEGEIVIVLPEAEIVKELSPQIPEEEEIAPKPNWQKWLDLFK